MGASVRVERAGQRGDDRHVPTSARGEQGEGSPRRHDDAVSGRPTRDRQHDADPDDRWARSRVVGITKGSPVARRPPHPDLGRSLVSSAVARRRSRSPETGRERTEQGTNGPFTVDTPISRECRTSSDSRRTDDDKRNRRVVTWMVAAGRRRHARRRAVHGGSTTIDRDRERHPHVRRDDHARRRTTLRPVRAASLTIDRGRRVTARAARVGSAHRRRHRHRLPETVLPRRLAPFLGPDPRFRSNRFLGSRIGACS